MSTRTWFGSSRKIYALAAIAAISAGALFAWGQTATPPATTVPTNKAPTADNKAKAVERFQKASELYKQDKFAEAKAENDAALALDPTNPDALLLKRILATKVSSNGNTTTTNGGATTIAGPGKPKLLTDEQVSIIRLYEMTSDDYANKQRPIVASIDRKTLEEFWDKVVTKDSRYTNAKREDRERFLNPSNVVNQVQLIMDLGKSEYIEKIKISTDPSSMITYRNKIQTFVLQNCATAACHGGDNAIAPRFYGAGRSPSSLDTYTNFYTLSEYVTGNGSRMINRANPEDSLLLQYALPKNIAKQAHPKNIEIKTRIANESADQFKEMAAWVRSLTLNPPLRYGIMHDLNPAKAATPETAPATQP